MGRKLVKIERIISLMVIITNLSAQNYSRLKIKEQYDLFNVQVVNNKPCSLSPNEDYSDFGDSQSFVFDSYITMFKTTQDKAYLYKCMFEIMCVMENRHDIAGIISEPRWGDPYHDGYIIGSMARYVHFIKKELPFDPNQPLHVFFKFQSYDWNQPVNYPKKNEPAINITTFWLFADWLSHRIGETLDWYIKNGTFDLNKGMLKDQTPLYINMQVGFARAALFNGITDPNTCCYEPRANNIASNTKGGVAFTDRCVDVTYNENVLRHRSDLNAYWWYHSGWAVTKRESACLDGVIIRNNEPNYFQYTEFYEDISHGAVDLMMFNDFHNFQANGNFTTTDMIRFRNTFTELIYDQPTIAFNNAVNGYDGPISQGSTPHNFYATRAMCYMPLEEYDALAATFPNVYDIIMGYYQNNLSSLVIPPGPSPTYVGYGGIDNKGHADVVAAQWKRECTNLELYNRNVVYNQDFFSKNKLTITPQTSNLPGGASYAEPIITTPEFIIQPNIYEPNIKVNMWAGESITLKPGVQIKAGSTFKASIVTSTCTDGARMASGTDNGKGKSVDSPIINPTNESAKQATNNFVKLRAVPNPFTNSTNIQFSLDKESKVNLKLIDNFGRVVYESKEDVNCGAGFNEVSISTESLAQGLYNCILKINNEEIKTINIVKQ